ncbi:(2Fe-2S)-binding protein [Amycolatopsis cynarae]|uniref:(2Fe-2S)-binding protein n=1 Tax=Amycolatopsis cynarae TaxID=2995223 RepID=A0ABY7B2D0_9PSEU|nr:(2Fe-2S)-binding protein [Amycolatopsis sp. HUAS 11-8]WAL66119.1 (2Fe-2S)-binding protein [Amycolatopsis sp. HUAS 11-8]
MARVSARQQRVELHTDLSGTGEWLLCDALLADPARFGPWHKRLAEWLHHEYGQGPGRTAAGYVMTWYLRVPAYAAALLLHHERRVPSLRPADLAFRLGGQRPDPDGIALLGADFHCLPSDPGAALPEATVVPDERALAAVLRAGYAAHATRFVAAYTTVTRLGRRTLWAAATDALDTALWWAGLECGDEHGGVADAALVLGTRHPPFTSASTLRPAPEGGWRRSRESCCFSYLLPGRPECGGCPRLRAKE